MNIIQDLYPSRVEEMPGVKKRRDPVVYTDINSTSDIQLRKYLRSYKQKGFLFVENFFPEEEVELFLSEIEALKRSPNLQGRDEMITEPNSGEVRSIFKVHALSRMFAALAADERLLTIVTAILGSEAYIHQSRVNFKPAFHGKDFYWHSDFETWHVEDGMPRMRAVSCSIALTDNNPYNGPLMVIPGSHKQYISCVGKTPDNHYKESLKKQEYGVPDKVLLKEMADDYGIKAPSGKAGSVVFFDCNIMHGSNSNISPWPRSNVFMVYNSIENQVCDPFGPAVARPEFIASRQGIRPLSAHRPDYGALAQEG